MVGCGEQGRAAETTGLVGVALAGDGVRVVGEVPEVKAPEAVDPRLEDGQPGAVQKPDLPPTDEPKKYQGNAEVKSVLDKIFSFFGFGLDFPYEPAKILPRFDFLSPFPIYLFWVMPALSTPT